MIKNAWGCLGDMFGSSGITHLVLDSFWTWEDGQEEDEFFDEYLKGEMQDADDDDEDDVDPDDDDDDDDDIDDEGFDDEGPEDDQEQGRLR